MEELVSGPCRCTNASKGRNHPASSFGYADWYASELLRNRAFQRHCNICTQEALEVMLSGGPDVVVASKGSNRRAEPRVRGVLQTPRWRGSDEGCRGH